MADIPSHHLRKMMGIILLWGSYNLSDERLVDILIENAYFQCLSGKTFFQWQQLDTTIQKKSITIQLQSATKGS